MLILSHFQADPLLAAKRAGEQSVSVSPDLGLTVATATLTPEGVQLADHPLVDWATVKRVAHDQNGCFAIDENGRHKLVAYSEITRRAYSLFPTARAPALLLSGVTMHRIKGIDPVEDTERKIRTIAPVTGAVLDTATALGYTAIAAARTADRVTTIELDPEVINLARSNPWSRDLFDNPKITQMTGDSSQVIRQLPDQSFDRVINDPPMVSVAGELYASQFYEELFRVLRPGGRLFHYVGDPESPGGQTTTKGVMRRLSIIGFKRVIARPEAFGVLAYK